MEDERSEMLVSLLQVYGRADDVARRIKELPLPEECGKYIEELETAVSVFEGTPYYDSVRIDFSVTADVNYYNGIIFKGFVRGVPESVLTGGQYDKLMKKMGKSDRAVGFAVYIDLLERLLPGSAL